MIQAHDNPKQALKRMLANGPMTGMPRRPGDQEILARLAAARLEPGKTYTEGEVNVALEAWLESFTEPYGIDHVTLRRLLVDRGLLVRTKSGSTYEVNRDAPQDLEGFRDIEPARMLERVREEREERKKRRRD
jgi:hypothetical protein